MDSTEAKDNLRPLAIPTGRIVKTSSWEARVICEAGMRGHPRIEFRSDAASFVERWDAGEVKTEREPEPEREGERRSEVDSREW